MLGALFSTGNAQKAQEYILLLGSYSGRIPKIISESSFEKSETGNIFHNLCKFNGLDPVATY